MPAIAKSIRIEPAFNDPEFVRAMWGGWEIVEDGETCATYPSSAIRFSLVWKAIRESEAHSELLSRDRVMTIFIADLRRRNINFAVPADPLSDSQWMALLDRVYYVHPGAKDAKESNPAR